jgi:hypothetical protein
MTYEALGGVVHAAQLEPLLAVEGGSERFPQGIRRKHAVSAELELPKQLLRHFNVTRN